MCNQTTDCCVLTCVGIALAWFLVSSTLLWATWNKVVAYLTNWKQVKWWQAFLVIATVAALCAPRMAWKAKHYGGGCHHGEKSCPYSGATEAAPAKAD